MRATLCTIAALIALAGCRQNNPEDPPPRSFIGDNEEIGKGSPEAVGPVAGDWATADADRRTTEDPTRETAQEEEFVGTVLAADQESIQLKSGDRELSLRPNDEFDVVRGGQPVSRSEIKEGNLVRTTYREGESGIDVTEVIILDHPPVE